MTNPETVLRGHVGEVQTISYLNNDSLLLSGDSTGVVRVWDVESARATQVQAHDEDAGITQICAISRNIVTQGRDGCLKLWQLVEGEMCISRDVLCTGHYHYCKCAPIPQGSGLCHLYGRNSIMIAGDDNKGAKVVDFRTSDPQLVLTGLEKHGMSMCLHCPQLDDPIVIIGSESGHVSFWDARRTAHTLASFQAGEQPTMSIAAQSATKSQNSTIDTFSFSSRPQVKDNLHVGEVSPDMETSHQASLNQEEILEGNTGTYPGENHSSKIDVVVGGAGTQVLWLSVDVTAATAACTRRTDLPEAGIGGIALRYDGRVVAVGGWDSKVRVFHMRTGKRLSLLKQHRASITAVEFSSEGLIACGSRDKTISIWDVLTD